LRKCRDVSATTREPIRDLAGVAVAAEVQDHENSPPRGAIERAANTAS
jgi:hypothetical protein